MAKALSNYMDALVGQAMMRFFTEHVPMHQVGLNSYVDFFALGITLTFASKFASLLIITTNRTLLTLQFVHS